MSKSTVAPSTPSTVSKSLVVEYVSPRSLQLNEKNARTHTGKQIEQIARSLDRRGFTNPLIVKNNIVYIGNGRLAAARKRELKTVPIIRVDHLSDAEVRAFALDDNKISDNSGFDRAILAAELNFVSNSTDGLDLVTGFDPAEVDNLLADFVEPERDPADAVPAPEKVVVSRLGDDWQLGEHRIRCGDAKSKRDMSALMKADRAQLVAGDPPYNLATADFQGRGSIRHGNFIEAYGEKSPAEFTAFLTDVFKLAAAYSVDGALHYYWSDWRHIGEYLAAGRSAFDEFKNLIVWHKSSPGMGSHYRSQHELVFLFKNGKAEHVNNIELGRHGRVRSNVWEHPGANSFKKGRLEELALHPTVKPVGLLIDILRDSSRRGDLVLDPFLGSGTTLIAAERIGRRARGLELDPQYVDVAVRRWQAVTKREAILGSTGQPFDDVAELRAKPGRPRRK